MINRHAWRETRSLSMTAQSPTDIACSSRFHPLLGMEGAEWAPRTHSISLVSCRAVKQGLYKY
eukprot:scaffold235816_cov46-Tisochrysis_lutea.AAC.1